MVEPPFFVLREDISLIKGKPISRSGARAAWPLIGAAFLLPLLLFQFRGWIEPGLNWRLWLIFALGALQGAMGWWMVASGLVGRVDVAQERLSIHLTTAFLILIAVIWTAQRLAPAPAIAAYCPPPARAHGSGDSGPAARPGRARRHWAIDGALTPSRGHLIDDPRQSRW
jgi:hypothetical protein